MSSFASMTIPALRAAISEKGVKLPSGFSKWKKADWVSFATTHLSAAAPAAAAAAPAAAPVKIKLRRATKGIDVQPILKSVESEFENWDIYNSDGFDDGVSPYRIAGDIADKIKDAKGKGISEFIAVYYNYGGNGSGGGNFLALCDELTKQSGLLFTIETVAVPGDEDIDWNNYKTVNRVFNKYEIEFPDLKEIMKHGDVEPTVWNPYKLFVSWKTKDGKEQAMAVFTALSKNPVD